MKEEQEHIPTSKVQRAAKFLKTGAKVGRNYVSHYSKKVVNPDLSRDELDKQNANDIMDSLSELKGSALKVAQMLSMDKNALPQEYIKRFTQAQYSAPALSYPLVVKTFNQYFGKSPAEIYDTFTRDAIHAASIGQVHQAELKGKKLAVKIQYPGVADSISTDLRIVKPFAIRVLRVNPNDVEYYMEEIESRLLEETDYVHELNSAVRIAEAFKDKAGLRFPTYYPELSNERIITMDWIDGVHMDRYLLTNPSQEERNRLGQLMWDFYDYQIHTLRTVHADPHPGNYLITEDNELCVLDFGCIKEVPEDFYNAFMQLFDSSLLTDAERREQLMYTLNFLNPKDKAKEKKLFFDLFTEMLELLGRPVHQEQFDFSNAAYFKEIFKNGERISKIKELRESKVARGPKDGIYISRVYFGLYNMLHQLGAQINTKSQYRVSW